MEGNKWDNIREEEEYMYLWWDNW